MNNRVEVRGVIVPSLYDVDYLFSYIQRGVITPESYFRNQLAKADTKDDLEVYINSQGGSVFAGYEMINALVDWKMKNNKKLNFVIGGMAASMGAVMIIQAADTVTVHQNTKIMFHGAATVTEGGEGAHKDTAELIGKMNAECKATMLAKYKLSPEQVDGWFAEGRAGWLTATEAKECGIANEIIGKDGEKVKTSKAALNMMQQNGLSIAAINSEDAEQLTGENDMIEKIMAWLKGLGLPENADEKAVDEFTGTLKTVADCDAAYQDGLAAGKLASPEKEMTDRFATLEAEKLALTAEIETLKAKNTKLTGGLNAPSDEIPLTGISGWNTAVNALVSTGIKMEDAMIQVQRQNPILFKSFLAEANKKK
jgi:ATP-dependent protease ClpP protease subunit